jgi:hypothetical protein
MERQVRRVVTNHAADGKAVVLLDGPPATITERPESGVKSFLLWVTDSVPADVSGSQDRAARKIGIPPPPGGTVFRIVDFYPTDDTKLPADHMACTMGADHSSKGWPPRHPAMHRTRSIDYAIVLSGEIDMLLYDSEIHLKAGDALVQQSTNHAAADRGAVRVTASDVVGCEVLPPILAAFHAGHPGIAVELVLTNRNEDLARGDADIAVRMVRPTQSGLVARKIGAARIGLYAHRDYLARVGVPRSLADLANHCVIGFDRDNRTFQSAGNFARRLTREDSASAATTIWRSSRRCARAPASAAARKISRGARPSLSRSCRTPSSTRSKSGSSCTRI